MKNITISPLFLLISLLSMSLYSQTNRVKVSVNWPDFSYENRVEVYDPANNLLVSICNEEECYQTTSTSFISEYAATYDLGCLAIDPVVLPNYYIVLYDALDNGWGASFVTPSVTVNVAGVDVLVNDGSNASAAGFQIDFNVNSATLCSLPDSDQDGVVDLIDQDDDNDGILDVGEGLGLNNFNCDVPSLVFNAGILESGVGDTVGSIYRFDNALEGYDVLVEITEIDNTTLLQMDDDSVDNADFLQTRLEFSGTGTPGITFQFTIVDTGTSTPASTIFRIGGTTWDCDGLSDLQESVRYYNPSAYGTDNPTSLTTDIYPDGAGITAGTVTYDGFATNTILRSYFQFLSNTFTIRMQAASATSSNIERLYAMSFTQCDIFDYKAPTLIILNGEDTDNDGLDNEHDIDSDNDGIPDNVEAQPTSSYSAPNGVFDVITGIDTAYPNGIALTDTDSDDIPDFIDFDSDSDGTLDIDENGMVNTVSTFADADGDGLDNDFEGLNLLDPSDVNDEIDNPSASVLPDTDGDLFTGGDLDYRDASDFGAASIDFDGVDDYLDSDAFLGGLNTATLMGWVKLDPTFNTDAVLFGQDNFFLTVDGTTRLITTTVNGNTATSADALPLNQWVHIAAFYSSSPIMGRRVRTYINGIETSGNVGGGLNFGLDPSTTPFTIGKNAAFDAQYFKGAIDEVRVFDVVLTEDQIQRMMYQEIQQNGLSVRGTVIDKDIVDITTNNTVSWNNLQAYYPMTNIANSKTDDLSSYSRDATLYNITTIQPQTAPMPYESVNDGDWTDPNTWLYGDVWDITGVSTRATSTIRNWAVVRINSNVTAALSVKTLAMLINTGNSLTITDDNFVESSWYLLLNGTLDLANDSQLIQTINSDLVTSSEGKILRRQEGNSNVYWYNYWSSPVGAVNATSLSDNNIAGTNNINNTPFRASMLKQSDGANVQFTTALNPPLTNPVTLSSRWFYNFQNGLTYNDWVAMNQNSAIVPGMGYTQKGTGAAGIEQQYIFEGKPNNGTILIAADDVDSDSTNESEQDVTLTTTLIGNPYPSALDARQFIADNAGVIQGTILLWEQWAGSSHNLAEYEGGYGYINDMTTERAYQHPDIPIAGQTQTQGIKTPTPFIPVGQGFFVEVVNDGDIEFNNAQRVFKQETLNESVFFSPNDEHAGHDDQNVQTNTQTRDNNPNDIQLIRFEFTTSQGASRRFVTGFSDFTSDDFDYGFDGGLISTTPEEDMGILVDDKQYVLQAFASITPEKVIDLTFSGSGNFTYSLDIVELQNIDPSQEVYLRDNQENIYWDLRQGPYNFSATAGQDNERFDIVFQSGDTLSNNEFDTNQVLIYVNNTQDMLFVKGFNQDAKTLSFTNMLGQNIKTLNDLSVNILENGISTSHLASGVYVISIRTQNNVEITKKIILE